jgi:hypothetical protein
MCNNYNRGRVEGYRLIYSQESSPKAHSKIFADHLIKKSIGQRFGGMKKDFGGYDKVSE